MPITKSDFLTYRNCSADFWFAKHMPRRRVVQPLGDFAELLISYGVCDKGLGGLLIYFQLVAGNDLWRSSAI